MKRITMAAMMIAGAGLLASVAPAATPVSIGPGRAFAPLTDGTVMMLSLDHLRVPWWLRHLSWR